MFGFGDYFSPFTSNTFIYGCPNKNDWDQEMVGIQHSHLYGGIKCCEILSFNHVLRNAGKTLISSFTDKETEA